MSDAQTGTIHERLSTLEIAVGDIQRVLRMQETPAGAPTRTFDEPGKNSSTSTPANQENVIAAAYPASPYEQVSPLEAASLALNGYANPDMQSPPADDQLSEWGEVGYSESPTDEEALGSRRFEQPLLGDREEGSATTPTIPLTRSASSGFSPFNLARTNRDIVRDASFWLSRVGIVLFLFGVVFLFKHSIDRNWLDEQARVGAGLMLGTILLLAGLLVHQRRRQLSQIMMGGSIATYYITGYAAYHLFPSLHVSYEQTFLFMSVVTFMSLGLSVRKGEVTLALIGLLGGICTPFALGTSQAEIQALVGYTCLLTVASGSIYFFRGWRSLLWCGVLGSGALLVAGYVETYFLRSLVEDRDRWALQGGLVLLLIAYWLVPLIREVLTANDPAKWPRPPLPEFIANNPSDATACNYQAHILSVLIPIGVLFSSTCVWQELVSDETWGLIELMGASAFAFVFVCLRQLALNQSQHQGTKTKGSAAAKSNEVNSHTAWASIWSLAYVQGMMTVLALTLGLFSLLDGNILLLALTVEGAILHMLSQRFRDRGTAIWGHLIFAFVGLWLLRRILLDAPMEPGVVFTNWQSATDLLVVALALGVSFLFRDGKTGLIYRSAVHVAVLGWLWRELHVLSEGDGYVMLAWAVYGLLLHLASRRVRDQLNSVGTSMAAHFAFEGAMGLLAFRLVQGYQGVVPMLNQHAALDLAVIGLALASSFVVKRQEIASIYRIFVHVAVLGWLWREAEDMDGLQVQGYVMLRWAAYLLMASFISHKIGDRVNLIALNAGYLLVACMLGLRVLGEHGSDWALLNVKTGVDVLVVCLAIVASLMLQPGEARLGLRVVMHAAVLGILWRELSWLPNGMDLVVVAWAVYAVALQIVGWWRKDRATVLVSHLIFAASGLWLLERIAHGLYFVNEDRPTIFTTVGLASLGVIAAGAFIFCMARKERFAVLYGLWLHIAFLGWIWQELGLLPKGGNGYVTIAWGAYAIALVVVGLRMELNKPLVYCGVSTLFIVAGKLFLIDLQYLEAVWRILLFLGFGALFLLLSYVFQGVSKKSKLDLENADL